MTRRPDARAGPPDARRPSDEPGPSWPERIRYHGARILLLVGLAAMITGLFPPVQAPSVANLAEGVIAPEDVIASIAFSVPKTPAELERDRREAAETIPPTFSLAPEAGDSVVAKLGRFFDALDSAATRGDTLQVGRILQATSLVVRPPQMAYLLGEDTRGDLRRAAERAATEILPRGVVDANRVEDLATDVIRVRSGADPDPKSVPVEDVLTLPDFYNEAVGFLPGDSPPDAEDLLRLILIAHQEQSLVFDSEETEARRAAAAAAVVVTKGEVLEGQAIVRAADPVGPEAVERLEAYEAALDELGLLEPEVPARAMFGSWLLHVMMLSVLGLLIFFSRPSVYASFRWLLLLATLAVVYFGAGALIDRGDLAAEWLPVAFVALPVAVLWDTRLSLLLVLVLGVITGTLEPFRADYGIVLVVMVCGAAAAMSVRAVRRRSETWVSIAIIAGAGSLVSLAYGLANAEPLVEVAMSAAAITGNATASALLAVGFLWVFELFTGITTDQTLLEWADPSRALLRRLSMEAPGTYAHTLNVANIAEAAATAIGANGLLCRVGVLYHDVGKMLKPHYFVENQPDSRNPHDKLKPSTSASIVREHVTEGVRLAREAKVPGVVAQFIREHHGTQRIGFFYEKAREESDGDLDPGKFCYPGPKPQSRETAIAMLADSCESAARAMHEPTPERMRDLIDTVVGAKLADGQLDEAPLTLREIALVKEQFVTILSGVVHRRIEYPETRHLTDGEGREEADPGPSSAGHTEGGRPAPGDAA